jgi:hypothetical protein
MLPVAISVIVVMRTAFVDRPVAKLHLSALADPLRNICGLIPMFAMLIVNVVVTRPLVRVAVAVDEAVAVLDVVELGVAEPDVLGHELVVGEAEIEGRGLLVVVAEVVVVDVACELDVAVAEAVLVKVACELDVAVEDSVGCEL